jgi:long-chain fatty acid transport protein
MRIGVGLASVAVSGALFTLSGGAAAGGFGIGTQSGSGTGNAFAGGAAAVDDASVAWYNPAGMTFLPRGKQVTAALHVLKPSFKFQNAGSTGPVFAAPGTGDGGDGGDWAFVPNAFFTMDVNPKWSFGLAMNAPFGLKTNYDAGWRGQVVGLKSDVKSVNINPSFAYKVSDTLSVGAGVSVQKLEAELTSCGFPPAAPACPNVIKLDADDVGYGFNLGLMMQAAPTTRIGVSYRSSIKYELEGGATFSGAPGANGNIKADLRVPDSASFSVFHQAGPKWELMGDITWTKWSTVQQLVVIRTSNTAAPAIPSLPFQWDDTLRFGVGANYKMNAQTKLRFGVAVDETPTNDTHRTPRLPDQDRTWVAFGVQFKPSKSGTLEVGYAHEFIRDANVNVPPPGGATPCTATCLRGSFDNKVDIISVQYSHLF